MSGEAGRLHSACEHDPMIPECPDCYDYLYRYSLEAKTQLDALTQRVVELEQGLTQYKLIITNPEGWAQKLVDELQRYKDDRVTLQAERDELLVRSEAAESWSYARAKTITMLERTVQALREALEQVKFHTPDAHIYRLAQQALDAERTE